MVDRFDDEVGFSKVLVRKAQHKNYRWTIPPEISPGTG
jgi:hypothetical protein